MAAAKAETKAVPLESPLQMMILRGGADVYGGASVWRKAVRLADVSAGGTAGALDDVTAVLLESSMVWKWAASKVVLSAVALAVLKAALSALK